MLRILVLFSLFSLSVAQAQQSSSGNTPSPSPSPAPPPPVAVRTAVVQTDTAREELRAVGTLRANEAILVRPEIAGRLQTVHFQEGNKVNAGQTLFTLDAAELRAELAGSTAQVELDRLSYERLQDLSRKQMTSQQNLDEARTRLDASRARQLLNQVRLDKTVIHAPFAGVVGVRKVSAGAYLTPGQELVSLDDISTLKLDFRIPEQHQGRVRVGQNVVVEADSVPERRFEGTVMLLSPQLDETTRTLLVRARLPNPEGLLRPGGFVQVSLLLQERPQALWVPEQAIWPIGDKVFVFRVVDGQASQTLVTLGVRRNGRVEVRSGINAGDAIIVDGQMKVRNGSAVLPTAAP